MEGSSIFDLMDELGMRLKLNDAYLARDDATARRLESEIRNRFGDRQAPLPAPAGNLAQRHSAV